MAKLLNFVLLSSIFTLVSCTQLDASDSESNTASKTETLSASEFLEKAETDLRKRWEEGARIAWIAANFITYDSQYVRSQYGARASLESVKLAKQAAQYDGASVSTAERRKLDALKQGLTLPPPDDADMAEELAVIRSELSAQYGTGQYCKNDSEGQEQCQNLLELSRTMAKSRDESALREAWQGWREISPPMRELYARQVEIANTGARDLGFSDTGAMWRAGYDMSAADFAKDVDAQWDRVKPLYEALHCHVRAKLGEQYGEDLVPQDGKIPAHLLGNMWAQQWGNIYELVAPKTKSNAVDLTRLIADKNMSELDMVKTAENFFVSLGLEELPETFWERSLFLKPQDREVQCHASAWNLDSKDDLRIKMCIEKTGEDFVTIHHELGHNYYQRAYNQQDLLFQGSANDGFHEALGDTISLSVTPAYLKEIDLLDEVPSAEGDVAQLLATALDKIAFLPFGLLVDKWRWQVFSGELAEKDFNKGWWALREKYQGIEAPVSRTEEHFDPGAKYHIPGNTPYMRYFLAHIQQFQFHRSLCKVAGYEGPLHRCTIYNNKEAGARLNAMMEMGTSEPWQNAMQALTGQPDLDAGAILDYFAPLKTWLDEQNQGRQCGW